MPRRVVSLEQLQAREVQAQVRLERERQKMARLKKSAVQAEAAVRRTRQQALGAVVEATCGALTPDQLKSLLLPLTTATPIVLHTPPPQHVLMQLVQGALTGAYTGESLSALTCPPRSDTGAVTQGDRLADVLQVLRTLADVVQDPHLSPAVFTDLQRTLDSRTSLPPKKAMRATAFPQGETPPRQPDVEECR